MKRVHRDILKAAHRDGPRTEADLGERLVDALQLVAKGYLTAGPAGFAITAEGARAIGKRLKPPDLAAVTRAGLDELVEPAVSIVQAHMEAPTGEAREDHSLAMTLLLTLCVAVGILARIVGVQSQACMEAIRVGMAVKLQEGPG